MQYALIKNNLVENIIEADQKFIDNIQIEWDHIEPLGTLHEQGLGVGIGWTFKDGEFTPPAPLQPEPTPEPRHISVGAFYDRFGDQKWPILSSDDLAVQGLIKDTQVRKYIDLDNPQLPFALDMLLAKGFTIDKDAILSAPIQPEERP